MLTATCKVLVILHFLTPQMHSPSCGDSLLALSSDWLPRTGHLLFAEVYIFDIGNVR